jgi:hypothetical protein
MLCPSHPPWLDHSNYIWRRVQIMKLPTMQFFSSLLLFASKHSLHHPVMRLPQAMFLPWYQRPSFTPIQNYRQIYNCVCFNLYVCRQQTRRQRVLNWMMASILAVVRLLKCRKLWWNGHAERIGRKGHPWMNFCGETPWKAATWKTERETKDTINVYLREIHCEDGILDTTDSVSGAAIELFQ